MYIKNFLQVKILLILFAITLLIFARYNGNYHTDYKYIWLFLDGNFKNDIYENNTILLNTSIVFPVLNFLNINLDNDLMGFPIHLALSIFAGVYLYKILKKIIPNLSTEELLFLIFSLGTLESMIVNTAKSSWIGHHTMVPSQFGLSFFYFYFWHVINKNKSLISVLAVLFILISPRTAWFPCACTFVYFLFPKFNIKSILWVIPSLVLISIYIYFNFDFQNYETKKLLFERAINKEQEEIVFHLQSTYFITFMILTYIFYFFSIKHLNVEFKRLFQIILYLTILTFIIGLFYGLYGQNLYPDPKIISLSPVRALYVYQLFFVIIYFFIIKKNFNDQILKYSFYILPFLFCLGYKGKILVLFILITLVFYKINFINKLFKNIKFDFSYIFVIFILLISINSTKNRLSKFDNFTFNKISHWSTHMGNQNNKFKKFFLNLRSCEDFLMYDNTRHATTANFFSSKSKYYAKTNLNVAFNKGLYDEHYRREFILEQIKSNKIENINDLIQENFIYISKKNEKNHPDLFVSQKPFGNLVFYFNNNQILILEKSCPLLFK
jgi:hypothetical protein